MTKPGQDGDRKRPGPKERLMRLLSTLVALAVCAGTAPQIRADVYPSRPVTLVVPFAAGGPMDTLGRILAEGMREHLGQPIIIENVGGAAGTIGVGRVARATPDGYVLSIGNWGTHVISSAMYSLPFDALNDFEPLGLVSESPEVIVVKKAIPATNLQQFIAWLKDNPDKANMATSGYGSSGHVAGLFFQKTTGTKFQFVNYRGLGPAIQGLISGETDIMIDIPSNSLPHVQSGSIKALAVMDRKRLASAPDVPTVDEAGLPGFYASIWYALWAPKRTPNDIVHKLNAAMRKALADPAVAARLGQIDQTIVAPDHQSPEFLRAHHKAEMKKWVPIIKDADLKAK